LGLRVLFALLAAFGGIIEVLQWSLGFGRDGDSMDFAVDVLAISLGLLAGQTLLSMRKSLAGLCHR
jgi:hypothetical protein